VPRRLFDSHCHIIDHRFPIVANQGYTPPEFRLADYLAETKPLGVAGGAVVSGSFQAFDQTYLMHVLPKLGAGSVGVTQLAADCPDEEIKKLAGIGGRAVRFNLFRGNSDSVADIAALGRRVHAVAGWHAEIYAAAAALKSHLAALAKLPQLSIDHLGMTEEGVPVVLELEGTGSHGPPESERLVFGTDIPSTRAKRPFEVGDIKLVERVLGAELAQRAFWDNPLALYRVKII
jgi:predicted TIM-barrel fold metal-dependent hydrolase